MTQPPSGTVTFLFTDIEGSTKLWQDHPHQMQQAHARHYVILRQAMDDHGGYVFKTVGDAFCVAFATAPDALAAALSAQRSIQAEAWPDPIRLKARIALHTGAADERDGDYFGQSLNRTARLLSIGHGGQTLLSDVTQGLIIDILPPLVSLENMGEHRLKDLGRPEQVFQLRYPDLPADFPPLRSLDNPVLPNNLPLQLTSFIGRENELTDIKTLLAKNRLLTLVGAGGSGKTRLSFQAAADLLDHFPDGVWMVELAPLSDPALVPQTVAQVLGVKEETGKTIQQSLLPWLKSKRLLLVLDNCEHLIAACAALAADLLKGCPDVRILVTSREPLNVTGEQTFRVPSLALPDPKQVQTVTSLSQYEAVTLFIERAQAVQPSFSVTDANAPSVAQICFHLDGIPLIIELAAARVRSLSVEEINTRLNQRFRLLTGGARNTLPRQQTLRALIDWSYDLLTEQEKALLCRLSVFVGGWTLSAAEAVCAGEDVGGAGIEDFEVLDLLTSLVDKSLAVFEERESGEGRFRLLETVRQYGQERLRENASLGALGRRHADWALTLAQEANTHLSGREVVTWMSRLEAEHDNLRAALTWYGDRSAEERSSAGQPSPDAERRWAQDAMAGLRLSGVLSQFWGLRGYLSEGRQWLEQALEKARGSEGVLGREALAARAKALTGAGSLAHSQSAFASAQALFTESLAIFQELGDQHGIAGALTSLGGVGERQSDYALARAMFEESLAIYRELGDRNNIAWALNNLGYVADMQSAFASARAMFEESLAIFRELGNSRGINRQLNNLGIVARSQGDDASARALYEESLTVARASGDQEGIANTLSSLGSVARDDARLSEAHSLFTESLLLNQQLGTRGNTLHTFEECAALALAEGNFQRAARLAGAAQAGREAIEVSLPREQEARHAETLAVIRATLGEEAFTNAWDLGKAMTLDAAVEYATALPGSRPASP